MTFALQDGVRTGELAARLGCSDQTVINYAKEGMPCLGQDSRGRFFDEEACKAWIAKHKPGFRPVHGISIGPGGKRPGAGRKAKDEPASEREAEANAIKESIERDAGAGSALFGDDAMRRAILKDVADGMDALELVTRYCIGPHFAKAIIETFAVKKAHLDLEERMGRLLKKEDVEAVWTTALAKVDQVITAIAPGVAADLAASLGLDARGQDLVRVKIEAAVERAWGQLR